MFCSNFESNSLALLAYSAYEFSISRQELAGFGAPSPSSRDKQKNRHSNQLARSLPCYFHLLERDGITFEGFWHFYSGGGDGGDGNFNKLKKWGGGKSLFITLSHHATHRLTFQSTVKGRHHRPPPLQTPIVWLITSISRAHFQNHPYSEKNPKKQ